MKEVKNTKVRHFYIAKSIFSCPLLFLHLLLCLKKTSYSQDQRNTHLFSSGLLVALLIAILDYSGAEWISTGFHSGAR